MGILHELHIKWTVYMQQHDHSYIQYTYVYIYIHICVFVCSVITNIIPTAGNFIVDSITSSGIVGIRVNLCVSAPQEQLFNINCNALRINAYYAMCVCNVHRSLIHIMYVCAYIYIGINDITYPQR